MEDDALKKVLRMHQVIYSEKRNAGIRYTGMVTIKNIYTA